MSDQENTLVPGDVTVESKHGQESSGSAGRDARRSLDEFKSSVREFAQKIPGSIGKAIESIQARVDSIAVHVDADTLRKIDALVEAGAFKSRGESAAYLIHEGLRARSDVLEEIESKMTEIERLRSEMRSIIADSSQDG